MIANPFSWGQLLRGLDKVPEIFAAFTQSPLQQAAQPVSLPAMEGGAAKVELVIPGPDQILSMVHGIIANMLGPEVSNIR